MSKVIAIVSFKLPQQQTLEQATATFQSTAPKYLNLPGLLRKNYFLTEDGMRAGGGAHVHAGMEGFRQRQVRQRARNRLCRYAGHGG